ncbi:MAG: hypothetical protein CHACPFDD_01112 [Phycisphaerae bacterium]|nr:hypothetical protein [Phycisphaerae bacterium]
MKSTRNNLCASHGSACIALAAAIIAFGVAPAMGGGSGAWRYQGLLKDGAVIVTGLVDVRFSAYDAPTGGNLLGHYDLDDLMIVDGLLDCEIEPLCDPCTCTLCCAVDDCPGPGPDPLRELWLEIQLKYDTDVGYETLAPRQRIAPAPVAMSSAYSALAYRVVLPIVGSVSTADCLIDMTQLGTGQAGCFQVTNGSNASNALVASSNGASGSQALYVSHSGTGDCAEFHVTNTSSTAEAVEATNAGSGETIRAVASGPGMAGYFQVSNNASQASALEVHTNASGAGLYVRHTGEGPTGCEFDCDGPAGRFEVDNPDHFSAALEALTDAVGPALAASTSGFGNAATITNSNTSNSAALLHASTAGSGAAIQAVSANGPAGDFAIVNSANNDPALNVSHAGAPGGSGALNVVNTGTGRAAYLESQDPAYYTLRVNSIGGLAATFTGNVGVSGTLSKSAGSFKIDHPLDPANKYLYHSFVESPDMKNFYDGVAVLDDAGSAVVELPAWFQALNADFRYQLTTIGAFAPVYVAREISDKKFVIAGGKSGLKVSWQVTGIRHDAYAQAHRIPVEAEKPLAERGRYLHPSLFTASQQPAQLGDAAELP